MMKYDFETIIDRKGHDALAVESIGEGKAIPIAPQEGFDCIPMWVADMNFATLPTIVEAIQKRLMHPTFGYFDPSEKYYESIIHWQMSRNHVIGLTKENIGYENGVLGGLISAIEAFTAPKDKILVHSPTYIGFTRSIENDGRILVHSSLKQDEEGIWRMDYEDMENKLKENHIHCAIFCSPHNPCGRVWEKDEIEKAMAMFKKYDCIVISDEIWSDLTLYENQHIPTQSVNEDAKQRTIALYAPSKTFNLAGLIGSYHIVYNRDLHDRLLAQSSKCHYNSMNVLSMHALIGAYQKEGQEWLKQLKEVIEKNIDFAYDFILNNIPEIHLQKPQGTYMLFLDCTEWCAKKGITLDELLSAGWKVGVAWQDGRPFHGKCSIRMNLALPLSRVQEAFDRLSRHVFIR